MDPKQFSRIEVEVVDAMGRAVRDATVMIQDSDQPHHDIGTLTDERGETNLDNLLPGRYTVAAYGPGGEHGTVATAVAAGRIVRVRITL